VTIEKQGLFQAEVKDRPLEAIAGLFQEGKIHIYTGLAIVLEGVV